MDEPTPSSACRILFLLPQKSRAHRVAQLISELNDGSRWLVDDVVVEFLPAVASFGAYRGAEGNNVRYLSSIEYFGPLAALDDPQSLLQFFDEDGGDVNRPKPKEDEEDQSGNLEFVGISAVVLGPGLHEEGDISKIRSFLQTMSRKEIRMETITPNPEFRSMEEELAAFRDMSAEAREEATRLQLLGPGKMAKFTVEVSQRLVEECQQEILERKQKQLQEGEGEEALLQQAQEEQEEEQKTNQVDEKIIDPNKMRYSCRKCRSILFGDDDLEDPPHAKSVHHFSARKVNHGSVNGASCQSVFLQSGSCPWMGDMSEVEGRLLCPKCSNKIGAWHWSGAQCSCGTWVVPAIQIPRSKVDEIAPSESGVLPSGTVISPFVVTRKV